MKKIIHIDMDAFYVSVEIRDNPQLAGNPVAVGGSRASRGVLSTCNYIAREYGIRSAMPTKLALQKCPNLILVPSRMNVYKEVSSQIRKIFERYTQAIEPLSLDEAFLDVTNCRQFGGSATLIAQDICRTIHRELNLTASAGVAPIKFLAKVTSDLNKPNGIYVVSPTEVPSFIDLMELSKIPVIGKVTNEKLMRDGLRFGRDIKASSIEFLVRKYGKLGMLLWERCNGIDNREIVSNREIKSIGVERTFPQDIYDIRILEKLLLEQLLPELESRASKQIASKGIAKMSVKVKFSDFKQTTKEVTTTTIDQKIVLELLRDAVSRGSGRSVRLVGIQLGVSLTPHNAKQISFDY